MKKYLRIILEVLLGLLFVAASVLAYVNWSGKRHAIVEVGSVSQEMEELDKDLKDAEEEVKQLKGELEGLQPRVFQLDAVKAALSGGQVLQDMEALYKGGKIEMTAERQAGIGALRMLAIGAEDPNTVAAFTKALEMAQWKNRLDTVCAAQNALAAAGQKVEVLSECRNISTAKPKEAPKHDFHWGYEGKEGPEHWGDHFPVCCNGKKQSPLNIVAPFEKSKAKLAVNYKMGPLKMLNNGHTIQVNIPPGSTMSVNGMTYDLLQFHFHRPSEEQINGDYSAMVAHFVHKSKEGQLAVIGVLLQYGKENPAIKTLWANLPPKENEEYAPDKIAFDPSTLLPKELGFYHYEGSLTTPPCTEGVDFYILKTPSQVSKEQVGQFPYKMNARPVQQLNGRKISEG
ncbi:MAG: Carbonic anhydrase precursor [Pseudomonadota bacterium]